MTPISLIADPFAAVVSPSFVHKFLEGGAQAAFDALCATAAIALATYLIRNFATKAKLARLASLLERADFEAAKSETEALLDSFPSTSSLIGKPTPRLIALLTHVRELIAVRTKAVTFGENAEAFPEVAEQMQPGVTQQSTMTGTLRDRLAPEVRAHHNRLFVLDFL
jgi:hypothetical protein